MNVIRRNRKINLLFFILIATILSILSFVNLQMTIFAMVTIFVVSCFLSIEDSFILMCYVSCFYKAFRFQIFFAVFLFVWILILTIRAVVAHKEKWLNKNKKFKFITLFSMAYLFLQPIIYCIVLQSVKYEILKLYSFLLLFIFLYFMAGKINLKKFTYCFVAGILLASIIAVLGRLVGLVNYDRVIMEDSLAKRFSAIMFHPNNFASYCLLAITFLTILIHKDCKNMINYLLLTAVIFLGFLTYSKTYLILVSFIIVYVLVVSFIKTKHKKTWLLSFLGLTFVIGLLILIFLPYFKTMCTRFTGYYADSSLLNNVTTGRVEIWKEFWSVFTASPINIIFGKSFMVEMPNRLGIHNGYFALLYQYGIVGCVIFVLFLFIILKNVKGWSKNWLFYLPILMLLLSNLVEDHILTHNGFMLWVMASVFAFGGKFELDLNVKTEENVNKFKMNCYCFFKRAFDIVVSFVLLVILAIPLCIVAILVKVTSKGPVFFKDVRVGKNGKIIKVYKFRSMYIDAESRLEQYLTKEQLEMWKKERKVDNDPRITKLGKFIRKTSIDELPQLINILKGDLSFVGNRPISKLEYDTHFSDEEKEKLDSMKPGLTGYWQAYGRSNIDYQSGERQKMCLYYIENAGVFLDIQICFKTVESVIFRRGAK